MWALLPKDQVKQCSAQEGPHGMRMEIEIDPTGPHCPSGALGKYFYSLVGGTMALSRVDALCPCPVPQNRAPGSFQCALDSVGGLLSDSWQAWALQASPQLAVHAPSADEGQRGP